MLRIHQAQTQEDRASARELFWEYLQWANRQVEQEFGVRFDIEAMLEYDMAHLDIYLPPNGRLLLARLESGLAGIACLKRLNDEVAEIKRMYVRSDFRRRGIAQALLESLIWEARAAGYRGIRLDSARFMKAAHALYRAAGFQEIAPYPESEIPAEFQPNWIFMEKRLS